MDQGQCTPLAVVPTGAVPVVLAGAVPVVPTGAVPVVATGAVPVVATGAVPVVANTPHYTIDERAAIYESMRNLYH